MGKPIKLTQTISNGYLFTSTFKPVDPTVCAFIFNGSIHNVILELEAVDPVSGRMSKVIDPSTGTAVTITVTPAGAEAHFLTDVPEKLSYRFSADLSAGVLPGAEPEPYDWSGLVTINIRG